MCGKLYIFNPGSDLALANGDENYVLPLSVRRMTVDLSSLPFWYADPDSYVLIPAGFPTVEQLKTESGVCFTGIKGIAPDDLSVGDFSEVCPWGWNASLVKQLKTSGLSTVLLPEKESLERMRQLSHRSLSVALLDKLLISGLYCGSATELTSEDKVRSFVEAIPNCILKAPWSGSGKGLFFCHGTFTYPARQWSRHIIASQRSVIGEILYNKVKDFAMEFYSDGKGLITFVGYSLFYTEERGSYKGSLLVSDSQVEALLSVFVSTNELAILKERLITSISGLVAHEYRGYLGVDMMICHFPNVVPEYRIHPCVEINLRMNMGVVARRIYDTYVYPDCMGRFVIDHFSRSGELMKDHLMRKADNPLRMKEGKIESGYLALTPVLEESQYRAYLIVGGSEQR